MESELLQFIAVFVFGVVFGVLVMLLVNKIRSGSASPKNVQQEYDEYQAEVERHFEETSKKFKDMTEQYQDLYQHLSIGATSLCRPDSAAAALADQRSPMDKTIKLDDASGVKPANVDSVVGTATAGNDKPAEQVKSTEPAKPATASKAAPAKANDIANKVAGDKNPAPTKPKA
ncbi:ZapG family protein [Arenicella xantha]|nr:DUF1043 family protein [Arenicella xantha]